MAAKPKIRIIKGLSARYRKPPIIGTCVGCAHCKYHEDEDFKHYAFCARTRRWRNNKGCQHYMIDDTPPKPELPAMQTVWR